MKIVTYNVNGLRPRISQFGSLRQLLASLDADIICFQETKLSRQELRVDVVWADGYESFFSCTRTCDKGRTGYSGVATFCRANSSFSSNEVALPLKAEEGFTGLLENCRGFGTRNDELPTTVEGLEGFPKDELLKIDSEGRCIITDHGHLVLFNIYGPRAEKGDAERTQFKLSFYKILQRRWETLIHQGRRIIVVGDFNIAPAIVDRCDAEPDFESNEFVKGFRSLLVENGGSFTDVFRAKHPERREAYTCWSTSTGAEVFNFGSRIDHILCAGPCLHGEQNTEGHGFYACHVKECDILSQFKRWKDGNSPSFRWKGGRGIKLEGSDHAPVFVSLVGIPTVVQHSTPSLSTRYCPQVQGCQQTLVSMFLRRRSKEECRSCGESHSSVGQVAVRTSNQTGRLAQASDAVLDVSSSEQEHSMLKRDECFKDSSSEWSYGKMFCSVNNNVEALPCAEPKKKPKPNQWSQLSLKSFFQKLNTSSGVSSFSADTSLNQTDLSNSNNYPSKIGIDADESRTQEELQSNSTQHQSEFDVSVLPEKDKNVALLEWQRIHKLMQSSIPVCKGHDEPCVARVVKKAGPTCGRWFYVCARAEGPASNPEANCGYFKWADSKKHKGGNGQVKYDAERNLHEDVDKK